MMSKRAWSVVVGVWALLLVGCVEDISVLDPCEDCAGECTLEEGFDFEGYEKSCGEGPDFCLRDFQSEGGGGEGGDGPGCLEPEFDIVEASVAELHQALEAGEVSCEWVVARHLERALQYDLRIIDARPPYNSFIALNSEAMKTARRLDDYQRCEGELSGPLHCVPFTIKGNYASKELPTTAGTLAIGDAQADGDAFVVDRMRRAGAVMIGTASMDEFAKGIGGHSSRSGKTGNSYDTRYVSGGSSGGSAVGVSASFAMGSLGTDNCSSLTLPAGYNGLVTLRPTLELISTEGIFPLNRLNQTAGPMARTVEDLARMVDVVAVRNPEDPLHCEAAPSRPESYLDFLDSQGLEGKRIGVLRVLTDEETGRRRNPFDGASESMQQFYQDFFDELEAAGAEIVDPVGLPEVEDRLYSSGYGYDINRFLERTTGAAVANVDEMCRSERYSVSIYSDVDNCLRRLTQTAQELTRNLERGRAAYEVNRVYVEGVLDELDLDAVVYPTDARGGARASGVSSNCVLSSYTGLPSMVVTAGAAASGMPVGMMFTGRKFDEATLFEIAYGYEQATGHRFAPELVEIDEAPMLSVEEFNRLHLAIGEAGFEEVLSTAENRWQLTTGVFLDLVEGVLTEEGYEELVDR